MLRERSNPNPDDPSQAKPTEKIVIKYVAGGNPCGLPLTRRSEIYLSRLEQAEKSIVIQSSSEGGGESVFQ